MLIGIACAAPARADDAAYSNDDGADCTASVLKASGESALDSSARPVPTVH